ncbi:MAG: hypothetical protein K9N34_01015 [Candidatus Marinimicrobia bacterium]|nr:hypothetical protein [Candidatus Neomarinimicrobiota bacterium]MCF7841158.1 hypothetical protein [Candidatus Neomarinimicrobiota bacterium]MCF7901941.1 hypothetical protein [Candidatus Neomarinimicrobiota bacterium]
MKKILIMVTAGIGVFFTLVVIIFFALSQLNPEAPEEVTRESKYPDQKSVSEMLLEVRDKQLDSLKTEFTNLKNEIFLRDTKVDSLNGVIASQESVVSQYEKQLAGLKEKMNEDQKQAANVKDLAKTFETMKVTELGPILNNVDDATVIAIYQNMGSRSKKMIMTALSTKRAAEITKELAGIQSEG